MKNLFIFFMLVGLVGCATKWDTQLHGDYQATEQSGQHYSYMIVDSKVVAISDLVMKDANDVSVALFEVIKANAIAGIVEPQFHSQAPTLNTDNAKAALGVVGRGIPIFGMMNVATTAVENDRGTTTLMSEGGDIHMKDSLNRTEVHSVANDNSTATTSTVSEKESFEDNSTTDNSSVDNSTSDSSTSGVE